jgi:hypothetical protein
MKAHAQVPGLSGRRNALLLLLVVVVVFLSSSLPVPASLPLLEAPLELTFWRIMWDGQLLLNFRYIVETTPLYLRFQSPKQDEMTGTKLGA